MERQWNSEIAKEIAEEQQALYEKLEPKLKSVLKLNVERRTEEKLRAEWTIIKGWWLKLNKSWSNMIRKHL